MRYLTPLFVILFSHNINYAHVVFSDLCEEGFGCVDNGGIGLKVIANGLIAKDDTFSIQVAIQTIEGFIDTSYDDSISIELIKGPNELKGTLTRINNKWTLFNDLSLNHGGDYTFLISAPNIGSEILTIYVDETFTDNLDFGFPKYCQFKLPAILYIKDSFDLIAHVYDKEMIRNTAYFGLAKLNVISGPDSLSGDLNTMFGNGIAIFRNIMFNHPGEYVIEISSDTLIKDTIRLNIQDISTSVEVTNIINSFDLYPNPVESVTSLNLSTSRKEVITINLVDLMGKRAYIGQVYSHGNQINYKIDLTEYSSGIYFIELVNGYEKHTKMIIIN